MVILAHQFIIIYDSCKEKQFGVLQLFIHEPTTFITKNVNRQLLVIVLFLQVSPSLCRSVVLPVLSFAVAEVGRVAAGGRV